MSFTALANAEVDAKSPMDDLLWGKVQADLDDLNSRVIAAGAAPFQLEIQGKLIRLTNFKRSIAMGIVNKEFTPTACRYMLKKSGSSALGFDIRYHSAPKTAITAISHQYNAATSSISRRGSALSTQSISRAGAQISTQSITHAKAANNIQSIILLGTVTGLGSNLVQLNLTSTIDSDSLVGDSIVVASATAGGNNGTFTIVEKNRGGGNNVVVTNASGVAQTGAAGSVQVKIMSYNFTNPVDTTLHIAGYTAHFASHTSALNDGDLTIYAVNSGGNNLWVKNASGVAQAGVAGTCDTNLFKFVQTGAVSTTDYIVGEKALTASHTAGANNGSFYIAGVNTGGNNVVLHVPGGATQGGVAGTVNTWRWDYNLPSDPTTNVSVGYNMYLSGHTTTANNGAFVVKALTASTIVFYNESGATQGGAAGNVFTARKLVQFAADQSAVYSTLSYIEMQGCADTTYNYNFATSPFQVLQVNRGGGSNYNVVIENSAGAAQASPAGYVQVEMKSIFSALPSLAADLTSLEANQNLSGSSTSFVSSLVIPALTPVMLYITTLPTGDPQDLTVILT